jgi:hypothetical protein
MYVKLNAEGARDRDHAVEKDEQAFRVVVVGDSYAAGFEVELEQTFWSVMERELEACPALDGRSPEVINISKRGYGSAEELLALRQFGFKYAPDWVVLAFLTDNDFRNNSRALKDSNRPYFVREGGALVLDESYADSASFRRWSGWQGDLWYGVLRHSRLAQLIRHTRRQIKVFAEMAALQEAAEARGDAGEHGEGEGGRIGLDDEIYLDPTDPAWRLAWQATEDIIVLMRDEVVEAGASFLLMTLSNAIQVNPAPQVRSAYEERIGSTDLLLPDRRLEAFAADARIPMLSVAAELRAWAEANDTCVHGFQEPWLRQGHWNVEGHRLAGEALARDLCARLDKNGPSD